MNISTSTVLDTNAPLVQIFDKNRQPLVTIDQEGAVTIHNEDQVAEAAKIFWREIGCFAPTSARVDELETENARLRTQLAAATDESAIKERTQALYEHYRWYDDFRIDGRIRDQQLNKVGAVPNREERRALVRKHNVDLRSVIQTVLAGVPPKPFEGVGAWFPVDVMGNPLYMYAPDKWDSYVKRAPFSTVGVNPHFWVDQIHTAKHTTDCPAKIQVLASAADHLRRYADATLPFLREAPHDTRSLCTERK